MKTHLKIKLGSLAEEIRLIRHEEHKWRGQPLFGDLNLHRQELSIEARAANIAYGFLRGREYTQIECLCYFPPNWKRVEYHVEKFGNGFVKGVKIDPRVVMQDFSHWLEAAKALTEIKVCEMRRVAQQEKGTTRRQAYRTKYLTVGDPKDHAELKARLKAKWSGKTFS